MCVIRLELWLNALEQTAHLCGFSPATMIELLSQAGHSWFGARKWLLLIKSAENRNAMAISVKITKIEVQ